MSLYLRLVVGPVVVCDIELFAAKDQPKGDDSPPPQLNGGSGTVLYPEVESGDVAFGFGPRKRYRHGYSAVPDGKPKPPPPLGPASPSTGRE